jgi:phosphoglucosamine mutase
VGAASTAAARRLFGTDGVRGVAGEFLTAELALALARAATARVQHDGRPARVLIIRDTRESGEMLEAAVAAGVAAAGGEALIGGILPTPGAPLLIERHGFDLGVVLSASHNPYRDNGIKFFGGDGYKLSDATEAAIEAALEQPHPAPEHPGRVRTFHGALEDYLRALGERFGDLDLSGRRILLDCANGATFRAAPEIFRRLGADVGVLAHEPDGRNINDNCGSTHLDRLQAAMQSGDDEAGFAFDGDGDRMLAVDRNGVVVDGDELIALAALHLRETDRLPGGGVAVTVMTNYGFHTAMAEHGVEVATTPVGDRYVLEALRERAWALGGEQSGHIIDRNFVPSGDGIAAALLTLEALGASDLADRHAMEKLPQTLVNVHVRDRGALEHAAAVHEAVERESAALEGRGRVLLRPSGTEPLVRVMVEAPTRDEAKAVTERLVALVESELTG